MTGVTRSEVGFVGLGSALASNLVAGGYAVLVHDVAGPQRTPERLGEVTADVWERFTASAPGADFTRIFPFIHGE
jgi:3-hydroxyisobutyrate dehydrogenase-like beta-hydroxyacid dehydrogenase